MLPHAPFDITCGEDSCPVLGIRRPMPERKQFCSTTVKDLGTSASTAGVAPRVGKVDYPTERGICRG